MEISVIKVPKENGEKLTIECHEVTQEINSIVKYVKSLQGTITGELDDRNYEISVGDIYYIESVDNKTYLYTKTKVFQAREKLYELEKVLEAASFIRISKAVIVNLMKIKSIKPAFNGRFSATLTNGEEVIISRKYVVEFREKLKGGEK